MPFDEMGLPTQGANDDGDLATLEYPTGIAGKSSTTGFKRWLSTDDSGNLNAIIIGGSATSPNRKTFTDRSGTITLGGTSQQVMAANTTRNYLFVQNISDTDMYVNFTTAAAATAGSIFLRHSGGAYEMDGSGVVSTQAVNIVGATTGKSFTAKEA